MARPSSVERPRPSGERTDARGAGGGAAATTGPAGGGPVGPLISSPGMRMPDPPPTPPALTPSPASAGPTPPSSGIPASDPLGVPGTLPTGRVRKAPARLPGGTSIGPPGAPGLALIAIRRRNDPLVSPAPPTATTGGGAAISSTGNVSLGFATNDGRVASFTSSSDLLPVS